MNYVKDVECCRKEIDKMKKFGIVLLSILIACVCLFCGYKMLQSFVLLEPTILQRVDSPDGKYMAYVFHCEGMRERFTYRLSVLDSVAKYPYKKAETRKNFI